VLLADCFSISVYNGYVSASVVGSIIWHHCDSGQQCSASWDLALQSEAFAQIQQTAGLRQAGGVPVQFNSVKPAWQGHRYLALLTFPCDATLAGFGNNVREANKSEVMPLL
jgi:hypothetical protein